MKAVKKGFDIVMLTFGFACAGVVLSVVPRVYHHSGLGTAVAVATLGATALVGGIALLREFRKRGRVEW